MVEIPVLQCKMEQIGTIQISKEIVRSLDDAAEVIMPLLKDLDREHLVALYVAYDYRVIGYETIAVGSATQATTSVRECLRGAQLLGAMGLFLAHNHPRGTAEPSDADIETTKQTVKAASMLGIQVVASLVVGQNGEYRNIMSAEEKTPVPIREQLESIKEGNTPDIALTLLKLAMNISVVYGILWFLGLLLHVSITDYKSVLELSYGKLAFLLFAIFLLVKLAMKYMTWPTLHRWPKVKPIPVKKINHELQERNG